MPIHLTRGHSPELLENAITVVIDVIRAFTMTHVAFQRGVERIYLVRTINEALALREVFPDCLLAGERKAKKIEGFDLQNSPAEMDKLNLTGRSMILTTTNGVPAALSALRCGPVLVTGFSNADSTARAVRDYIAEAPVEANINLVGSHPTGEEDMHCAHYLASLLGRGDLNTSVEATRQGILASTAAQKFLDPAQPF